MVAALLALVACRAGPSRKSADPAPASSAPVVGPAATSPAASASSRAAPASPPAPADASVAALALAPLVALAPPHGTPSAGPLAATLALDPGAPPARVELVLSSLAAPKVYARPLAFFELSRALGLATVAPTVVRRFGLAELGGALRGAPDGPDLLRLLAVQNDGTVDGMLTAVPEGARRIATETSTEAVRWARSAASLAPEPGEDPRLVRGFVEMLVLDYLAGNGARAGCLVDEPAGVLLLAENAGAFPLWTDPHVGERLLGRLRAVQRFPRGLRDALARLDRERARAVFSPGAFETWLLPPRTLVELDERRLGLLSLLDARVAELGAEHVLSL
jgi:hypothetical protein